MKGYLNVRTIASLILYDFLCIMSSFVLCIILLLVNVLTVCSSPIIFTARPWRQNRKTILNIVESLASNNKFCESCNHNYEGYAATKQNATNDNDNDDKISKDGYKKKSICIKLGKGYNDFQIASEILLSFRMTNNLSWYSTKYMYI